MDAEEKARGIYDRIYRVIPDIHQDTLASCYDVLTYLCFRLKNVRPPIIEIDSRKNIVLGWHKEEHTVEICFNQDKTPEVYYQFSSSQICSSWTADWFEVKEDAFDVIKNIMI